MISKRWSWIGAKAVGTSHIKLNKECEDSAACIEFSSRAGSLLVAVVSDGAGSACQARLGSYLVVRNFAKSIERFIASGATLADFNESYAQQFLDCIRDQIFTTAHNCQAEPRDFAATLVAIMTDGEKAVICHVGDGAVALRDKQHDAWIIPSWPSHGEYASTTNFVTEDPQVKLLVTNYEGDINKIAVFSDGLERQALDFTRRAAFDPFLESVSKPLLKRSVGRERILSRALRNFLESEAVCNRTDDDKTLIVAQLAEG